MARAALAKPVVPHSIRLLRKNFDEAGANVRMGFMRDRPRDGSAPDARPTRLAIVKQDPDSLSWMRHEDMIKSLMPHDAAIELLRQTKEDFFSPKSVENRRKRREYEAMQKAKMIRRY